MKPAIDRSLNKPINTYLASSVYADTEKQFVYADTEKQFVLYVSCVVQVMGLIT
jgi:hypothetical protein